MIGRQVAGWAAAGLALLCLSAGAGLAQSPPPKVPASVEAVRQAFAAAVAAQDRARIAKLSRFPLALAVYGLPPKLSQARFLSDKALFDGIFFRGDAELVRCLKMQAFELQADAKPKAAPLWLLDCNGNEYSFGEDHGRWAFVAYENINE